jgi:HSP20 family protein
MPVSFHLRRDLDEAFRRSFGNGGSGSATAAISLPLTIWEDDEHVYLEADVPGFKPDSLDVRYKDERLLISGARTVSKEDGNYLHNERMFGRFERAVSLPNVIDPNTIDAELADGMLFVTMTKKPEAQAVKISVKGSVGDDSPQRLSHEPSDD